MDIGLLLRMGAGSDEAVVEFQRLLAAGDPEAVALYRQHQERSLGPDPLAEGACAWPEELAKPGVVLVVPPGRTSADDEHTSGVIVALTCGNAEIGVMGSCYYRPSLGSRWLGAVGGGVSRWGR